MDWIGRILCLVSLNPEAHSTVCSPVFDIYRPSAVHLIFWNRKLTALLYWSSIPTKSVCVAPGLWTDWEHLCSPTGCLSEAPRLKLDHKNHARTTTTTLSSKSNTLESTWNVVVDVHSAHAFQALSKVFVLMQIKHIRKFLRCWLIMMARIRMIIIIHTTIYFFKPHLLLVCILVERMSGVTLVIVHLSSFLQLV